MNSFLLTSRKKLAGHEYLAPVGLEVRALRVRNVILDNPTQNVIGHRLYLAGKYGAGAPADSEGEEFIIPDGNYSSPDEWATTVERILNDAVSGLQSEDDLTQETYATTPLAIFEVHYNKSTRKMEFTTRVSVRYQGNIWLWFDQRACDYLGANVNDKLAWIRGERGSTRNMRTTAFTVLQNPRYFRMTSKTLGSSFGHAFDDNPKSPTIAVVPLNHQDSVTVWENPSDVFYQTRGNEIVPVSNVINVEFYLEESLLPIEATEFAVTFDIIS